MRLKTSADLDKRVHDDISAALAEPKKKESAVIQPSLWRIIMKSPITKPAAAAVIVIAVLIGIHQFGGSIESVSWADVKQAFLAQPWVHIKYDNGREWWHNLCERKTYLKNEHGTYTVVDLALNVQYEYLPGDDHIMAFTIYKDGKVPPWQPNTAWELVVGHLEKADGKRLGNYHEVEKHADTLDGRHLIRFDIYLIDAFWQRILTREVWANPVTRLPVRIRDKLTASEQKEQSKEYITGDFDFPKTGPATIYDLGLPAHLKIVNYDEREATTTIEASKVIQAGSEASENFPMNYRAIIWEDKTQYGTVHLIYHHGHKISVSTYINLPIPTNSDIPLTVQDVLKWTHTQEASSATIFDGEKEYIREHTETGLEVKVHHVEWPYLVLQVCFRLEERFWPYVGWAKGRHSEITTEHPETPLGCVVLLEETEYFFVDPEKDYLCVKEISMRSDGNSRKRSETCWSNFSQLPTGHWYPTKEYHKNFGDPERGTSDHEQYWNIDIKLLEDSEYPSDIFNGEKLLEGAEVKTY